LFVDNDGDFIGKPMARATGRQILIELLGHLGLSDIENEIASTTTIFRAMMTSTTVRWSCLAGRELRAKAASPSSRRLWVEPYPWLLSTTGATGSEGQPLRPRPAGLTGVRGGNARNGDADPADLPGGMSLECRRGRRARNRTGFSRSER
jgi:hypothetical protein